ncbi:fimbrial biogenesis chaperone [Citrobacter portucalensis]|uniref:Molecular chaperone n=1 Tax=Citrobacter portucalensis TaxID=1639133 RepID=A0A9X4GJT3_9ENTR|nr:molecular chaperone [Citrobacter portucalensis]MDE9620592.1 molecular chaperone [Citrobacter portucalensis]
MVRQKCSGIRRSYLGGTRIIYPSNKSEVQMPIKNKDDNNKYLVQSWVTNVDGVKAPFIITPPIYKMEANSQALLHIVFSGDKAALPQDRESLFVANVKSVSAMPAELKDKNTLQFAMKVQLKLFWRPSNLKEVDALSAWEDLQFSRQSSQLIAKNSTPFYISLLDITVGGKPVTPISNDSIPSAVSMMIPPFGEQHFSIPAGATGKVSWSAVNDYGAATGKKQQQL